MHRVILFLGLALALPAGVVLVGCDESSSAIKETASPDGATPTPTGTATSPVLNPDAGPDAPTDCYLNPTTHLEIINACTSATKITKNPTLPRLHPDGGLPPLQ